MDAKGAALMRALAFALLSLVSAAAHAHVGSPDLFHTGDIGPYPARVTIRMPDVIPGRAEISVRVETSDRVEVSFLPLYAKTAIKNAPPPDIGRLVKGETQLYAGELWLMDFGAYSVEVRLRGEKGSGSVQIPLTSVATRQLPMSSLLGKVLSFLAFSLVIGGIGIASAAGREASLAPGEIPGKRERRNGVIAGITTAIIIGAALVGGRIWWKAEERDFRRHLREGAWPDLSAEVKGGEHQRVLQLEVGRQTFTGSYKPPLIADHGKLIHLFLIREGSRDAFAHLHPVRKKGLTFEVALPPIPEGRYKVFCDLTFEGGTSSTAAAVVEVPPRIPLGEVESGAPLLESDPDDSWATYAADTVPRSEGATSIFRLPDGTSIAWKAEGQLRAECDASLRFEVSDAAGKAIPLEPYMGMLCHAAVLRSDGSIFAHLHPSGNYSMAAQLFFAKKQAREALRENGAASGGAGATADEAMHHHHGEPAEAVSSVYLPYEFPEPGEYRIWVQCKAGGRVLTAVFDARVLEKEKS